jgi:tRNA threonylcarbamoyladenosine biosynthesis protein TsaB
LTTFALDTATPSPALAIVTDGDVRAALSLAPTLAGGRRVMECVHEILMESNVSLDEVDRVVVGVGPGGFTGLRIGIATAMGLAQALGVPAVGASSLEALAMGIVEDAAPGALLAPVIDARRREVFGALYRRGAENGLQEMIAPAAFAPADFVVELRRAAGGETIHLAGDGLAAMAPHTEGAKGFSVPPVDAPLNRIRAANLVRRVDAGAGMPVIPQYHRLPDAEVNRRRAAVDAVVRPAA